jgi:hypothetical protein
MLSFVTFTYVTDLKIKKTMQNKRIKHYKHQIHSGRTNETWWLINKKFAILKREGPKAQFAVSMDHTAKIVQNETK